MKVNLSLILTVLLLGSNMAWASGPISYTEQKPTPQEIDHPYDQLLTLQMGPYTPRSLTFTNWNNTPFDYSSYSRNSFLAQIGWGIKLFDAIGTSFYFSEGLGYSQLDFKLPAGTVPGADNLSVKFHMFSFDTRLMQAWESFPVQSLEPFWDAGLFYTLYSQAGSTDLVSSEGDVGNFAAGVGLRYWINRGASLSSEFPGRYVAIPVFLTAKLDEIFPNNKGIDPGSTTVLGGITVGL